MVVSTDIMDLFAAAFGRTWFYVATVIIGVMYGFGGLVHIGNIFGFGELPWSQSPVSWRVGDVFWGILDVVAVVGILTKAPIGIVAVALAALTQIVVYGFWPEGFALNDDHYSTLRGMVYFNSAVLVILGFLVFFATAKSGT